MLSMQRLKLMFLGVAIAAAPAFAEKKYGPGATDTEIKIGQTMPYSGSVSGYGTVGNAEAAYFKKVNAEGGVNGRQIKFISLDDGFSSPRTVEQTRKLVEQEEVLLMFGAFGTATNAAVQKYLNAKQVPQLFVYTGASRWNDPAHYPWTMGWLPSNRLQGRIYAEYLLQHRPNAKVGVLYQNDDFGKDYLRGFRDGLGDKADRMIVAEASYEVSDPTIDSQIVSLQGAGADTFFDVTTAKFAAQAIRRVYDIGWKPLHFIASTSSLVDTVLRPAGLDKSIGLISAHFAKDVTDPQWQDDAGVKDYVAWAKQYFPTGLTETDLSSYAYTSAQVMVEVLKRCGDDLSRENVMRQAANLKDLPFPLLLPGIKVSTAPTDFRPLRQLKLIRFDGKRWVFFGDILGGN